MVDFPEYYLLLLSGPNGVGKHEFCLSLAKKYLEEDKKLVFVTTERTPKEIEQRLRGYGLAAKLENLYFIDGSIWSTQERQSWLTEGKKKVIDVRAANPTEMFLKLRRGLETLRGPVKIIFDSLSAFLFRSNPKDSIESFKSIAEMVKQHYGLMVFTLHEDLHDPWTIRQLEALADGQIEMRYIEEEAKQVRQVRIKFMRGFSFEPEWRTINLEGGMLQILQ